MATYTSNYAWTKPSGSDQVDVSVLNDNLDSQDSIMHDAFLNMAEPFSELSTYSVGNIVLYGTKTYKCRVAVTTAGSWTGATNWDEYKLSEGGSSTGGEVKNLDNGMLSHSTDSGYITVNLDVPLTAGKEYKITLRDPAYNYVDTKQILWTSTVEVNFPGTGSSGEYKIQLTQTTASLYNYGGQGWRDIYCDIVSDFSSENYSDLTNKPTINGVELSGNKTASQLGMSNSNTFQGTIAEWNQLTTAEKKAYDHASIPDSLDGNVTFPASKVMMQNGKSVEETIGGYDVIHEVTGNGVKTYSQLLDELYPYADLGLTLNLSGMNFSGQSAYYFYTMALNDAGDNITLRFITLKASGSVYKTSTLSWTLTDRGSGVVTSGVKIQLRRYH